MRVILDLTSLLGEGKLTEDEFKKFRQLSTGGTETIFSSIFVGLGVVCAFPLIFLLAEIGPFVFFGLIFLGLLLGGSSQQWFLLTGIYIAHQILFILYVLL